MSWNVRGDPSWLHDSVSPVRVSPVRNGPDPGSLLESILNWPVLSEVSIDSMLQVWPSVQGSPSSSSGVHADGPPAGLVELSTWPFASVATHSDAEAHETEVSLSP
ncbi:MAG: hypothetical protein ACRDPA_11290 [Solirubrobacteraceae bacterium]